jgi:hypothetical protein
MDHSPYYTNTRINSLKSAADSWVLSNNANWDIAACWHLPLSDIQGDMEQVEINVGKKMRRYFNLLDRRIFKAKYKRGCRVPRFITLEHAASVGWHVHGILATPAHVTRDLLIDLSKQTWLDCLANTRVGLPKTRLAWCEPIEARYPQYSTKQSFGPLYNAKGTIDILNTYFG